MLVIVKVNFSLTDGDNLENMEGVSLQAVTLADGSTAYIQHNSKGRQRTANWWLLKWYSLSKPLFALSGKICTMFLKFQFQWEIMVIL